MIILRFWWWSKTSIIPLEVPKAMIDETTKHVGVPKFLFPASEKA